ncbi:DUF4097 family beta strand repeat-containing protein [Candidatus Bipolaricaulota bacterium]
MKRWLCLFAILVSIGVVGSGLAMAEPATRGFGFGGPMAMAFFPDMSGINTFMSENGLPSMGSFLLGAGGSGRGGVIGGSAFGGIGWGVLATSEGEDRSAELVFGGGGFDIGAAIGGDESSVLTIGAVLGGGANVLSISGYLYPTIDPEGLVPEETHRELGRALGFVQPYVSMAAQLLPWMGLELRIGYVLPVFGIDFGDQLGIPSPSLDLSGPTVSLGIAFGGIGSGEERDRGADRDHEMISLSRGGSFAIEGAEELVVENMAGEIRIESYRAEIEGTGAGPIVHWEAVLTASEKKIDGLQVEATVSGLTASVKTIGDGEVDYVLRVPAGLDLKLENGAGTISLAGHEAQTIILTNGAGEVNVEGVRATVLVATTALGSINILYSEAEKLIAEVGVGEIALGLDSDVSAVLKAKARLGDITVDRFPGMVGGVRGLLGKTGDVVLGEGDLLIELKAGIGKISVWMHAP